MQNQKENKTMENDSIFIGFYRPEHETVEEAAKVSGLYVTQSDNGGGYAGVMDAIDAANAALDAAGREDIFIVLTNADQTRFFEYSKASCVLPEFSTPSEFWAAVAA